MRELHGFHGGLKLDTQKSLSNSSAIQSVGIPEKLVLRMRSPIGTTAKPLVEIGEQVKRGQPLARPGTFVSMWVHAPTSGKVVAIGEHQVPHPSGLTLPCISLEPDGLDTPYALNPVEDYRKASPEALLKTIHEAGIIGMGGAGFPSHVKLKEGINQSVEMLIINGVECEPFISCDDRLMRERAAQVVEGARILAHCVQAANCVIAIEADMPEALESIQACLNPQDSIEVVAVPAIYPQGGEKQLIQTLTGQQVPSRGLPIHIGMLVYNVATVAAVYRAVVLGEAMTSRIVTVSGEVPKPGNYEVMLGTPIGYLLRQAGWTGNENHQVLMGGPMMGVEVEALHCPIIKISNCILVQNRPPETEPVRACIRCGECVEVCPVNLLPQELYSLTCARDYDRLQDYHIFDCIECGCCDHVCPSHIPLVHHYRFAKSEINALDIEKNQSSAARLRYQQRLQRVERQKLEKQQRRAKKLSSEKRPGQSPDKDKKAEIQAAMQRTRDKRERLKNRDKS